MKSTIQTITITGMIILVTMVLGISIAALLKFGYGINDELAARIGSDCWKFSMVFSGIYFYVKCNKTEKN